MVTTTSGIMGLNPQTSKVMNYMTGKRTAKQMVGEFFGLREEAIYDDDGENVIDFINDFKDEKVLEAKGVHFHPRLKEMGITDEMFDGLFANGRPDYGTKSKPTRSADSGEQGEGDSGESGEVKKKQTLSSAKKRTTRNKK